MYYDDEPQDKSFGDKIRSNKGKLGLAVAGISAGVIAYFGREKKPEGEPITPDKDPKVTTKDGKPIVVKKTAQEVDLSNNPADLIPNPDEDEELEELDEIEIEEDEK